MSTKEKGSSPLRPTGLMERFNIIRNHVKFYNNFQVSATYSIPCSVLQTHDLAGFTAFIYSTLRETLKSQPILNVVIEDEGTPQPKWKRVETIDLYDHVKITEHDPVSSPDAFLTEGHAEWLDRVDEIPAWRVRVGVEESNLVAMKSTTLSFVLAFYGHHAIVDGVSCGAFHMTFLEALNALIKDPSTITTSPLIRPSSTLKLLPSLEEATPLPISIWFAIKQIIKAFIYNPSDPQNWSGRPIPRSLPTITPNLRTFSLAPDVVSRLLQKCRENKTTLTALISVLTARKIAEMHPSHSHLTGIIPFSFRKFSGHSPRAMGVFVSTVTPYFAFEARPPRGYIPCATAPHDKPTGGNNEALWESARQTRQFIANGSTSPKNQMVGMLKFASDLKSFFLGMWGKKRDHAFEISNIGTVDGGIGGGQGEERAWFDKMVFSTGLCVYGDPFSVLVVSAKGGNLTVSVSWMSEVTEEREGVALCKFLDEWMSGLGEEAN
ncbi:alcohol acetyltransferase [Rhexocercosporidium sp. MPI-PUGE-AT-0058]|nr:alcohol acetyltransferase [Rhexocercosporidium sp. MPI-PUGE-AT-0058]